MSRLNPSLKDLDINHLHQYFTSLGVNLSNSDTILLFKTLGQELAKSTSTSSSSTTGLINPPKRLLRAARKLQHQVPIEFIANETEFFGLPIKVRPGVLIPRPETEGLVELGLQLIKDISSPSIVEMGTGSGCITCALANQLWLSGSPFSYVGYEPYRRGFLLTLLNLNSLANLPPAMPTSAPQPLQSFVRIFNTRLLSSTLIPHNSVDLLISNPPYIPTTEINSPQVSESVRKYEPWTALDGGDDGLDSYRVLLALGLRHFAKYILVETHSTAAAKVAGLFEEGKKYSAKIYPDLYGRDRYVLAQRGV